MKRQRTFTATLHQEGDLFVAECREVGTVSQGSSLEEAVANLNEATELFLEEFPPVQGSFVAPRGRQAPDPQLPGADE
jgi:predicted RNase H-like HicB family nuclease